MGAVRDPQAEGARDQNTPLLCWTEPGTSTGSSYSSPITVLNEIQLQIRFVVLGQSVDGARMGSHGATDVWLV